MCLQYRSVHKSKFRRSGVGQSSGIYENRMSNGADGIFQRGRGSNANQEIVLTEGGLRALSKLEGTPVQNYSKVNELRKGSLDNDNFKSISNCSNYDTVAMPVNNTSTRQNPFKQKPSSISCVMPGNSTGQIHSSSVKPVVDGSAVNKPFSKSNVFLRAARSITKTKSVSGSFIVKTTICKSINTKPTTIANDEAEDQSTDANQRGTSMPEIQ